MAKQFLSILFILLSLYNVRSSILLSKAKNFVEQGYTEKECPSSHFHTLFDESKFNVDDFTTTTKEGYILKLWRVRLKQAGIDKLSQENKKNISQPIYLQHAL